MAERTIAGRYRLLEPLGREGDWLAEDTELGRQVVLRLLDSGAEPLEANSRAAAALAHPHIARVYDHGESDGERFVVGEHLPGGSLEARLATGGPLPADDADGVARDVASALAYAHALGVAHGDLSAASVQFDGEGRAKVADFGTATDAAATRGADITAFGAVAFRMLTGRESDDPTSLERLRPDAPAALVATVLAALSGDVADGAGLVELLGPAPAPVRTVEEPQTEVIAPVAAAPARRRTPVAVGVVVALLALLGAGIAAAFFAGDGDDGAAPVPSVSLPRVSISSTETEEEEDETTAPPPTTTTEATTSTAATTTRPRETTTQAPPPTTAAPPTTEPLPPPPTEEPTTAPPTEPTTTVDTTTVGTTTPP